LKDKKVAMLMPTLTNKRCNSKAVELHFITEQSRRADMKKEHAAAHVPFFLNSGF
jgi:hypothetical protein